MYEQMTIDDFFRKDREVVPIEREAAKQFVESIHYSRKLPSNVVYSFGLFEPGGGYDRSSNIRHSVLPIPLCWDRRERESRQGVRT